MELMRLHTPCETIVMRLYFSFSDTDWLPKIWYLGLSCRKKAPASRGNQPRLGGSQVSTWRCLQRPEKHPRRKAVTRGQIRRRRSWNWESPIRKNRRRRTRVPQAQWTTTPATNDLKVRRRRWIHRRVGLKSYFIFLSRAQSLNMLLNEKVFCVGGKDVNNINEHVILDPIIDYGDLHDLCQSLLSLLH